MITHCHDKQHSNKTFALLNDVAEYAGGIGSVYKHLFLENSLSVLSTTASGGGALGITPAASRWLHLLPGGCEANHSHDATAGTDGRQGSPSRTASAN